MLRFFLSTIIILLLGNVVFPQQYKETLKWPQNKDNEKSQQVTTSNVELYLRFEGAFYPNAEAMIPHFYKTYPISNAITQKDDVRVQFNLEKYEDLSNDELLLLKDTDPDWLALEPTYDVFGERGRSMLVVTVPAIRRNNSTGKIQKLVAFSFSINENQTVSKKLSIAPPALTSVLGQGEWYKVSVSKTGIYRITYSELQTMGLSNLQNVSVWGHGGKQLSFWNNQPSPDDLIQIPIWVETGNDGVFNQGDYILFFAEGPVTWAYNSQLKMFTHAIHGYAPKISYFVTTSHSNPLRVQQQPPITTAPTKSSSSFDALVYFERNDTNLIKSGRQWFGESFDVFTNRNFNTGLTNPVVGDTIRVNIQTTARSGTASSYTLRLNGTSMGSIPHTSVNLSADYSNFVSLTNRTFTALLPTGQAQLELQFNKPSPTAKGWLDFITVNARQNLQASTSQLHFRDVRTVGTGAISEFSITTTLNDIAVWDISSFFQPRRLSISSISNGVSFRDETGSIKEYVAFTPSQAFAVEMVGTVPNQNIHAQALPQMVIVAHPNFLSHAQELAQIHSENSGLVSLVVTTEQVYNEFSGGNVDVGAIRNLMRMFYQRSTNDEDRPKYLLLFGDGSYDNLSQNLTNTNYIPTFQSANSINGGASFVTDDFFGLLDLNEGEATGLMDIGVGRIPASSRADADAAIAKIRSYLSPSSFGSWHNLLSFMADDQDGNEHMRQADDIAKFVENNYPQYNIEKIYFDAYPQITTAQGHRYPDVTNAINNRANLGALIMNYTGHANARWLAHEKVLMVTDIQSWRNFNRLPLFITATCEYSRFDDFSLKSAGEHVLFSPKGGGIALVSTTRVVYSYPNFILNQNFFQTVFSRNPQELDTPWGGYYTLGEVVRLTKNLTGGDNKRSFMLLGDPALRLHYPTGQMDISEINSNPISVQFDTLKALDRIEIKGIAQAGRNATIENGEAQLTLFDKERTVTTLTNDGGNPFTFKTRENVIYKGRSSVIDGQFRAEFIIPKDINYSFGTGRFSMYATNGTVASNGYFEDFIVGGISTNPINDTEGPSIKIFMNDSKFVSGGTTDPNPKLLVMLTDSSGINTTGIGIGHDLTATISGATTRTVILNEHYQADVDNFRSGKAQFQLINLEKGTHTVRVKAWDVFNNSSEAEIDFVVRSDEKLELTHVLNYPNPFTNNTAFFFEHNQPFESMDVSIQIFSPSGKIVKTINQPTVANNGYRIGPIPWDGLDDFGDRIGRGVYFYRLRVRLSNGKYAEAYQKLVILK